MHFGVKLGISVALVVFVFGTSLALNDRPAFTINSGSNGPSDVLRIGYFANFNHAPAVIGVGNGDYQKTLGNIQVERQIFSAGPAAVEALIANKIDVAYVGPNPAINGYMQSGGVIKVIAGVSSGGAVFVVQENAGINSPDDFTGKKLASPQLGNTQDVALRKYLKDHGYDVRKTGGDPEITPASPSDILTRMLAGSLDGAWVPEPWGERLVRETGAKIFLDERDLWPDGKFSTALIICRVDYLANNQETIKRLLEAHVEKARWIDENKEQAITTFNDEVEKLLNSRFEESDLKESLSLMEFTYDPLKDTVIQAAQNAYDLNLLEEEPDLSGMFDLEALNSVLAEKGLEIVE